MCSLILKICHFLTSLSGELKKCPHICKKWFVRFWFTICGHLNYCGKFMLTYILYWRRIIYVLLAIPTRKVRIFTNVICYTCICSIKHISSQIFKMWHSKFYKTNNISLLILSVLKIILKCQNMLFSSLLHQECLLQKIIKRVRRNNVKNSVTTLKLHTYGYKNNLWRIEGSSLGTALDKMCAPFVYGLFVRYALLNKLHRLTCTK